MERHSPLGTTNAVTLPMDGASGVSAGVSEQLTQTLQAEVDGLRKENRDLTQELLQLRSSSRSKEASAQEESSRISAAVSEQLTQTLQAQVEGLRKENTELTQDVLQLEERAAASAEALIELKRSHDRALGEATARVAALEAELEAGALTVSYRLEQRDRSAEARRASERLEQVSEEREREREEKARQEIVALAVAKLLAVPPQSTGGPNQVIPSRS